MLGELLVLKPPPVDEEATALATPVFPEVTGLEVVLPLVFPVAGLYPFG